MTTELVTIYLNLCEFFFKKRKSLLKKELIVKSILGKEFNLKCQTDLIDMQLQANGGFKFIMIYQDHITKFMQLRPLKSKRALIAYHLVDIFKIFGAPNILQSDDGREFSYKVVAEVCITWPELKIVYGK